MRNKTKLDIESLFVDKTEQKKASELLKKYIDEYTIESVSDKNSLFQLIQLEIISLRLQAVMNNLHVKDNAVPIAMIKTMHENITAITTLKDKLGLNKEVEKVDEGYKALELLKKKFALYREENQGSRTLICPHCGQMTLLKIRMDKWLVAKHPFFKDRVLTNKHLIQLYKDKKITKEDVAKVLECSTDYIEWIISKHYSKKA